MVTAKIYIEGGGEGRLQDTRFREAWSTFFGRAGLSGKMPRVIRCGSRLEAFKDFETAVRTPRANQIPILLVDSEGPVAEGHTAWQHLKARPDDRWDRPAGASDNQAFLMVQLMETWFLADRATLRSYFGNELREQHFKNWPSLENVPKATVLDALSGATAARAKSYAKGRVSFELLGRLDPSLVESACPSAHMLLDRLRKL